MNNALIQRMKDGCQGNGVQGEEGAPLTNEIKIFKHCFTILAAPHTLPLLPTCLRGVGTASVVPLLKHNICLSGDGTHDMGRKCPLTTLCTVPHAPQLIMPGPMITLRDISDADSYRRPSRRSARLYFVPSYLSPLRPVPPLTISFRSHHAAMKDVGF